MNNKTVAIVQARMSSARLPGKVLKDLAGKPVLRHVLDRLGKAERVDCIVVATTLDPEDDVLVEWCKQESVPCYRGDREDVLSRFYECAVEHQAANIVRVTSDNPLVDPLIIDKTIELFFSKSADYCANNIEKTFPHGLDVEIITFKALEESYKEASESFEREHVTQFVRHRPNRFHLCNLPSGGDWHSVRLTLDEDQDYQLIKLVMRILEGHVDFLTLKKLFGEFPALVKLNEHACKSHANYNMQENII